MELKKKVHTVHGGRKNTEKQHKGHTSHILAMAISTSGKFLVRLLLILLSNSPKTCTVMGLFSDYKNLLLAELDG